MLFSSLCVLENVLLCDALVISVLYCIALLLLLFNSEANKIDGFDNVFLFMCCVVYVPLKRIQPYHEIGTCFHPTYFWSASRTRMVL